MASFAEINSENVVLRCVVLDDKDTQDKDGNEVEALGASYLSKGLGGTWKKTSYNSVGNTHRLGGTPFRKNGAAIGYTFDESRDAFIPPKPYDSWILNETTAQWEAPKTYPTDGKNYRWNEDNQEWQT
jgi:hypothetical protein